MGRPGTARTGIAIAIGLSIFIIGGGIVSLTTGWSWISSSPGTEAVEPVLSVQTTPALSRIHDDCPTSDPIVSGAVLRGIYRMRSDGTELCLLATAGIRADNPVWSPDGRYIAFVRVMADIDNFEVVVINADGTDERNVSNSPGNDSAPAWLPGYPHTLTFVSDRGSGQNLYRVDLSDDDLTILSVTRDAALGFDLEWAPDGLHFATSSSHISIHHAGRSDVRPLVSTGLIPEQLSGIWPSWSPDGRRIAFEADHGASDTRNHDIFVIDADGRNINNLTDNSDEDNAPSWSPNGRRIVFASNRGGYRDIYVMDDNGANVVQLTDLQSDAMDPAWSPDGTYIVFTTAREWSSD